MNGRVDSVRTTRDLWTALVILNSLFYLYFYLSNSAIFTLHKSIHKIWKYIYVDLDLCVTWRLITVVTHVCLDSRDMFTHTHVTCEKHKQKYKKYKKYKKMKKMSVSGNNDVSIRIKWTYKNFIWGHNIIVNTLVCIVDVDLIRINNDRDVEAAAS